MLSSNTSAANGAANYIEDVFSTWLYTGNGSAQTITNGIDLAGKGGLVWIKNRTAAYDHILGDTARGASVFLRSNTSDPQSSTANHFSSFNSNGFSISSNANVNLSSNNYASWTFRKQPKFFDVVTFTSNGSNAQQISHSLGSVPGCIILKRTDNTGNWIVWHRGNGSTDHYTFSLNNTSAALSSGSTFVSSGKISSTIFSPSYLDDHLGNYPVSGGTYVAYLFAHNAGGFGLTGTDNVISCGSYTGNGSATGPVVTLGYEPQWLMIKRSAGGVEDWVIIDNMRGMVNGDSGSNEAILIANGTNAEVQVNRLSPIATGFQLTDTGAAVNASGSTYIYIAIRRGPMKVPTTGTSVFNATLSSAAASTKITTGFTPDTQIMMFPPSAGNTPRFYDRLRGVNTTGVDVITQVLQGASTAAESSSTGSTRYWQNDGYQISSTFGSNQWIYWTLGRAPGFMDVCCYTANSSLNTSAPDSGLLVSHNLNAVPELIIIKDRTASSGTHSNWAVWYTGLATQYPNGRHILLNSNAATVAATTNTFFNGTGPTSTNFRVWNNGNNSTDNYVAYLFSSLPGVSKVGSYTGTGTTQQINCGFSAGARFVLIKRTDSTGDWYVWDSARGIVAGNDPYLLLNSTAAEVTNTDYVDTYSAGFEISSTAPAAINASGGTFVFLAIA